MHIATAPRWRMAYGAAALAVLLIPALAMRFTGEVNWGAQDFAAAAGLLLLLGLALELVLRRVRASRARIVGAGAALAAFLLIWAELAVGILPG